VNDRAQHQVERRLRRATVRSQGVKLVQFTDTHLFGSRGETLRGVDTLATLQRVLAHAAPAVQAADAVLVTGDLVQDDPLGYASFRECFAGLGKPVWCLPGNHDIPEAMQSALAERPFQYCGQVDCQDWRIVLLDSFVDGCAGGSLSANELLRLEAALGSAEDRRVMICVHHQPVPVHSRWLDALGLENAADFLAIIDRHAKSVRGVLWGHVHQTYDGERNGVRLMATPSTCAQFRPRSDDFAIDERPPAYRSIQLLPQGRIETEITWVF
jgi:Icc protein